MNIGQRMEELASKNGFTQYRLAKATGLSQPFIGKLFKGEKSPSLESLESICNALGVTLSQFFSEDEYQSDPGETKLLAVYRSLPEDRKHLLLRMSEIL